MNLGSIKFNGKEVSELPVPVIAKMGLLRTFQQTRIYSKLNCVDNMLISHKASDESLMSIFSKVPAGTFEKIDIKLSSLALWLISILSTQFNLLYILVCWKVLSNPILAITGTGNSDTSLPLNFIEPRFNKV